MNKPAQSFRDLIVWQRHMNSQGSLEECRYYLILGDDLGYGDCTALEPVLEEVSRLLVAYAKAVARNNSRIIRTDFD
jgi:hypothetical protein